ncbi:MAG: PDZ domain-containing protein [Planctomycetota bacterium]
MHPSAWLLTSLSPFLTHLPQDPPAAPPAGRPAEAADSAAEAPDAKATAAETFRADQTSRLAWRHVGPVNMSGRVTDFEAAGHTWFIGSAGSGVWKSSNRGTTWTPIFEHEAAHSVGDVAVATANPDVVWVGTGEDNARNSVSWGDGAYKSTDGGHTWKHMGLADTAHIGHIAIHPENPDIVFVAALGKLWAPNRQRGVFRTKDGGDTWVPVLSLDENTGAIDVRIHPKDPKIVWACAYERRRNAFDDNDPEVRFGDKAGLYRSQDGGDTWERITAGLPTCKWGRSGLSVYAGNPDIVYMIVETERSGWANGKQKNTGRNGGAFFGVQTEAAEGGGLLVTALSPDGPAAQGGVQEDDVLLEFGETALKAPRDLSAGMKGLEVGANVTVRLKRGGDELTMDVTLGDRPQGGPGGGGPGGGGAGGPFSGQLGVGQRANVQDEQGEDGFECGGVFRSDDAGVTWKRVNSYTDRPFYYSWIYVDPNDDRRVYCAGVNLLASSNGGSSFANINHNSIHVDFHTVWVDPADSLHVVATCDGGVNVSRDRGRTWEMLPNLPIGQFYHVDCDNEQPYNVYGGLQDNGSWGGPSRTRWREGIGWDDWVKIGQGDGFGAAVDQDDPNLIVVTSQNGGLVKYDRSSNRTLGVNRPRVRGKRLNFAWDTPFFLSPHNSKILYWAGNYPLRSLDQGRNAEVLGDQRLGRTERGVASAFAESPRQAGLLYVGTDDGALWRSDDHGHTWKALHDRLWDLPGPRFVSSIHPSAHQTDRVYVTFDGHRSDDLAPHVFVSDDRGDSWRSLTANLPMEPTHVAFEDRVNQDLLFLGTEFGCWASLDRGKQWFALGEGLPTVPVRDLVVQEREQELVAATHGRGLWIVDVSPLRQLTTKVAASGAHLFAPRNQIVWHMRSRGTQGDRNFYAPNPAYGVTVYLWLADEPEDAPRVTIHDVTGERLTTLTGKKVAGVQALQWGAQTRGAGGRGRRGRGGPGGGPGGLAMPSRAGTYSARFEHDGKTLTQMFSLLDDPLDAAAPSTEPQPASRN